MKIALVCTEKLPVPPVLGGAIQIYIEGILPFLSEKHEITVYSLESDRLPQEETLGSVRYKRLTGRTRNEYVNNLSAEKWDEYSLIHVFNRPLWVLPISGAAPGSAVRLSLHNEMFLPNKIDKDKAYKCINRVSFITAVSRFIADGVKALYPSAGDKLQVVYSGVDANLYKPVYIKKHALGRKVLRIKYGLDKTKVVLFVGRLSNKKGPHVLLEAMKSVMDLYPNTSLMIIGSKWYGGNTSDSYTHSLKSMAQQLKGPVVFTGFMSPADIPKHFSAADIFVCTSQWKEPLARVHYEAMAAGLPIITTNRGGNAEVIETGVNGFVIDGYNRPEALTEKIIYLLEHEDISLDIGKNARKMAEEKYSWERVANELLALFDSV